MPQPVQLFQVAISHKYILIYTGSFAFKCEISRVNKCIELGDKGEGLAGITKAVF